MTQIRVYLPLSVDQCRELAQWRVLDTAPPAYAVTHAVRASDPAADAEGWEYAALQDAAASCAQSGAPVLVAAADLDPAVVDAEAPTGSQVRVTAAVPIQRIAAFHVGDDVLTGAALPPEGQELELSWYDTTELPVLLELLEARP